VQETLQQKGFAKPAPIIPLGFDQSVFRCHLLTDSERVSKKEQFGLKGFTIGYFGRIVESKGVTFLLEAVSQAADRFDLTLMVVGSGDCQSAAESLSKRLNIESKIRWLGERRAGEIPELLSLCDVIVIPSLTTPSWKEQFGRIAVEAMACGVPVIASDSGSLPEVLAGCGLIVKERSANAISEQLIRLQADEALRHDLSSRAEQLALSKYTWESAGRMLFDLYSSVFKPGPLISK
jgi:glycosyltransferase involved in cell wall biosynthesis